MDTWIQKYFEKKVDTVATVGTLDSTFAMLYPASMIKRTGRPPIFPNARQYSVRLTEGDAYKLRELGGGSVSLGVARIIAGHMGSGGSGGPVSEPDAGTSDAGGEL